MDLVPDNWYLISYGSDTFIGMYRKFSPVHSKSGQHDAFNGSRFLLTNLRTVRRVDESATKFTWLGTDLDTIKYDYPEAFL